MDSMLVMVYPNRLHDGMLDISPGDDSKMISDLLRRKIIRRVADEDLASAAEIFRAARMCFELTRDGSVTDLTVEDMDLLYSLPLERKTEILFATMNAKKVSVSARSMDPAASHAAAMSVLSVMSG